MGFLVPLLLLGAAPAPLCVPGTSVCASSDGRGGVRIDASGTAQASPAGATASGQASGDAQGRGAAQAAGNANASGSGSENANGSYYYREPHGRSGTGASFCPVARAGLWSGIKVGGCIAFGWRWESLTFELETQVLYGGDTRAVDWTLPISFVIPLANHDSLFEGPYLRFGGSPVGVTFARAQHGGNFIRFGIFAGAGYELNLADWVAWRVIDVRLALDMGTRRAMDDEGHWLDPGILLGTGLTL